MPSASHGTRVPWWKRTSHLPDLFVQTELRRAVSRRPLSVFTRTVL